MQDFFFAGLIGAIALGVLIFKGIIFAIHMIYLEKDNEIIEKNLSRNKVANHQAQQIQKTMSSIENVIDWKVDDPRLVTEDLRQQFLMKTKTRRTPTSDRASPRERVPLATTDFGEASDDEQADIVPIYTYNPSIGGTQTVIDKNMTYKLRSFVFIVTSLIFINIIQTNGLTDKNSVGTENSNDRDTEKELLDKEYGVRYADTCEACKFLAIELEDRFDKLGQTSQVIETGYQIDGPKKKIKYTKSELYFIESMEGVCDKLLEYNIHKERSDSNRFARGMSSTFKTLHNLVDRGVKVDLGIPMELWDTPSAEITALKQKCEDNLEKYHDLIEQWYWGDRKQKLQQYLCRDRVLDSNQKSCLDDPPVVTEASDNHAEL